MAGLFPVYFLFKIAQPEYSLNVMFRKRSWFLCAGHCEAAKEATVTPMYQPDVAVTPYGAGLGQIGTESALTL